MTKELDTVSLVDELAELDKQAKAISKRQKELKESLIDEYFGRKKTMLTEDAKVFAGSNIVATITESVTNRFDSKKFKDDEPELYNQYLYETKSTSVRLKNS